MHQGGGNLARASAIEQISQEKIEPVHKEVLDALGDKGPGGAGGGTQGVDGLS